jgi:DNA-binding response OmpR family regulator
MSAHRGLKYGPPSVLLVDSDTDSRDAYAVWLGLRGFSVNTANGGAEAVSLLSEIPHDIIVTELVLADGGGVPLLVRLLDSAGDAALLIVLTTQSSAALREEAFAAGAQAYLVKPCAARLLGETIAGLGDESARTPVASFSIGAEPVAMDPAIVRALAIRERLPRLSAGV